MKVTIVGSGDIWSKSNSACYLIDKNIMVDMPNGTYKALSRFKLKHKDIRHILFTHFHGDHYFDIPFHFLNMSKNKEENNFVNIYATKAGFKKIKQLLKLAFPNSVLRINRKVDINYISDYAFEINQYKIEKVRVKHSLVEAHGYIFNDGENKVGFTGDARKCKGVMKLARTCDYLFCDTTYLKGNMKHMGIDNILELAEKYKKCTFICSHIADKTRAELKKLRIKNVIVASDKDVIEI